MKALVFKMLVVVSACYAGVLSAAQSVEFIQSGNPGANKLPFSEAVRVGDTLYLSGQLGISPATGALAEGGMKAEARQTMQNIQATLNRQNLQMSDIVKCTVMMADMSQWSAFNEVYVSFFDDVYPARSAFGASGLALGAQLEVECIAVYSK